MCDKYLVFLLVIILIFVFIDCYFDYVKFISSVFIDYVFSFFILNCYLWFCIIFFGLEEFYCKGFLEVFVFMWGKEIFLC